MRLYWQQVREHRVSFFITLICIPIASLLINAIMPYFLSQAIGGLATQNEGTVNQMLIFATLVGVLGVGLNLLGFQALVHHQAYTIAPLRNETFRALIVKDLRFFVNEKIGSLTSRYIDFVRSFMELQNLLIIRTLGFSLSLIVGLVLIGLKSPVVAMIIFFLLVLLIVETRWSLNRREPYREQRKLLRSEIHGRVADGLTNSVIVKTFGGEQRELAEIEKLGRKFSLAYKKDFGFTSLEGSLRIFIMIIMEIVAIAICSWLVVQGKVDITTVIFSLTYLQLVGTQIFTIGDLLNGYEEALLEASPMSEKLMLKDYVKDQRNAVDLQHISPSVRFNNVAYRYEDSNDNVLENINLSIEAGQKVGLVGHSGAGKTTVTHLLLRFSDVTNGAIIIDNHDIRDVSQESLRQNIAYVPQEPMLFHRSLRENIAYGKPDATDDEIRRAAKQANALEFIEALPKGLDTIVGERGVKLSGGQRQRVAIARAVLKDAPILILDEATSALDSESEKLIQSALEKLMKGRTSIVIAHRLSTIAKLDRIVVLEKGKIVEDGSHKELLEKDGVYANLWKHQSGGFLEE